MKYVLLLMNLFLPNCEKVSTLTSQSLDESIPLRHKIGMRIHMFFCKYCRDNSKQFKLMRLIIQKKNRSENSINKDRTLSADARKRISDDLKRSDFNE
jgi:hypothetical protein